MAKVRSNDEVLNEMARIYCDLDEELEELKAFFNRRKSTLDEALARRKGAIDAYLGPLTTKTETLTTSGGYEIRRQQTEAVEIISEKTAIKRLKQLGLRQCIKREVKETVLKDQVKLFADRVTRLRSLRIVKGTSVKIKAPGKKS